MFSNRYDIKAVVHKEYNHGCGIRRGEAETLRFEIEMDADWLVNGFVADVEDVARYIRDRGAYHWRYASGEQIAKDICDVFWRKGMRRITVSIQSTDYSVLSHTKQAPHADPTMSRRQSDEIMDAIRQLVAGHRLLEELQVHVTEAK